MTAHDVQIIRQCLRAAVDGPFFPDWEFSTLIGAEREEIAALVSAPVEELGATERRWMISNVLLNLTGYPHGYFSTKGWGAYIDATPDEVEELAGRLREDFFIPETIYVYLLDEGSASWRPVEAEQLGADLFRIVSKNVNPEDEEWEFPEGAVVRCVRREFSGGGDGLVAVEEVRVSDGGTPSS